MRDQQNPPPKRIFMETQDGRNAKDAEAESQCTQQMDAADESQVTGVVRAVALHGISHYVVRGQAVAKQTIAHPGGQSGRRRARVYASSMPISGHI